MRPFQANKHFPRITVLALAGVFFLSAEAAAQAQQQQPPPLTPEQQQAMQQIMQSLASAQPEKPGAFTATSAAAAAASAAVEAVAPQFSRPVMSQEEYDRLLEKQDSPQYKAEQLAREARFQTDLKKTLKVDTDDAVLPPPPQDMEDLQDVTRGRPHEPKGLSAAASDQDDADDTIDAALNMRRDAQKEAALSFGARGGLAKRNYEIMQSVRAFENTLDTVFNFRALLVLAPSGLLIEPPIVRESIDSMVIAMNGSEAAVADKVLDINKQARIVSAPRDWRQYLVQSWTTHLPRPPRLLWPKGAQEQKAWDMWVEEGWRAGVSQADMMFESNLNRLVSDHTGMVRYRMLLAQGMISQPYAMHEDRGVTGSKTKMRVGDRALRITGPSQFLTGSDLWKPADR